MNKLINKLHLELNKNIDLKYKEGAIRIFKEKINPLGVRTNIVKKITNSFYNEYKKELTYYEIKELSEKLLSSNIFEYGIIAIYLLKKFTKIMDKKEFIDFDIWIDKYIHNWAHCDLFLTGVIGEIIKDNPELAKQTLSWTKSNNRWKRRASAVAYIKIIKNKTFLPIVFQTVEKLKYDNDDLVQKGYGWALKDASYWHKDKVINFLLKHKDMPRTALRYACERLKKEEKESILI